MPNEANEWLRKLVLGQQPKYLGGDVPSIDDIANRIHKAWYNGKWVSLMSEARAYVESLRTPADKGEIPEGKLEKEISQSWDNANEMYGKKVASQLKEICPYDGNLLGDLVIYSLVKNGLSEEEALEKVIQMTDQDWQDSFNKWEENIKESFKVLDSGKWKSR